MAKGMMIKITKTDIFVNSSYLLLVTGYWFMLTALSSGLFANCQLPGKQ